MVQWLALRMTWKRQHPTVSRLEGDDPNGIIVPNGTIVPKAEMKIYSARLQRSATLPKYDITIQPQPSNCG